tara:strand:- start:305 stop:1891 length:1587 start_codon:yes stop_codon:yes gene_type:complete
MATITQKVQGVGSRIQEEIKNNYGGNLTHFYNSIGPEYMTNISLELFNDPEIKAMSRNVAEYEKFVKARNENKPMFESQINQEYAFRTGVIDTFDYGLDMIPYETPPAGYMNDFVGKPRVEAVLAFKDNLTVAYQNYARELRKTPEEMQNVTIEQIEEYANAYIGAKGGYATIQGTSKTEKGKTAKHLAEGVAAIGQLKASTLKGYFNDPLFKKKLTPLKMLGYLSDNPLLESNVEGKEMFNENLTQLVEAYFDLSASDFSQIGVPLGSEENGGEPIALGKIMSTDGSLLFDEDGGQMMTAPDVGEEYYVNGAMLAFKTPDGRLIMQDEDTSGMNDYLEPTVVVMLQNNEGFLSDIFGGGDQVFYKEIDFTDPIKAERLNKLLAMDQEQYETNLAEEGIVAKESGKNVTFADIKLNSDSKRFKEYSSYYMEDLNKSLNKLNVQGNTKVKSLLLGIALSTKNPQSFIENMPHNFNAAVNQSLNAALLSGDEKLLAQAFSDLFASQGLDPLAIKQATELSGKIFDSLKNR